jgi:mono/diheme cytochrome c family protein
LKKDSELRLGRELVVEHRCLNCHSSTPLKDGIPELAMDAPHFDGIGSRRNVEWMAAWIADPKALRPNSRMPKMVHGAKASEDAAAIAAYLGSLESTEKLPAVTLSKDSLDAGKKLFETLHCAACHVPPDSSEKAAAHKLSLNQVEKKFTPVALVQFLKQPDQHFNWIRMPTFKLSDEQRLQLAAYLHPGAAGEEKPVESGLVERGKKLARDSGCFSCHSAKDQTPRKSKEWGTLNWKNGCLSEQATEKSPWFAFQNNDLAAIRAFAATGVESLHRHVPVEFAARQVKNLNCASCHGEFEGFPPLEILGQKLKPEWMGKFIAGEVSDKPRPWLESQMPGFGQRGHLLSQGLSMQYGFSPKTAPEKPVDKEAAEIGHKLISAQPVGFSCVQCHGVGNFAATAVFEAPGNNLTHSADRMQESFYRRWLRNPTLIDSQSKMPVFFDEEGRSPLPSYYEGDGEKQISAIWEYFKLRDKMPAPLSGEQ